MPGSGARSAAHDVSSLKGRIAEALVETIFRRAGYAVSRVGPETQVQRLVSLGADEFLPDFLIRKPLERAGVERPLHRLIPIEVQYRRDVGAFLQTYGGELFERVADHWPDLCFVFVTDRPEPGRSCFQVVDLWNGSGADSVDLHMVADLDIYRTTVEEYESLVRAIFSLIESHASGAGPAVTA
ncbi:MAG: hypothetical protein ACREJG_09920 [Candidatus Rokuibacteriota bacterium]